MTSRPIKHLRRERRLKRFLARSYRRIQLGERWPREWADELDQQEAES